MTWRQIIPTILTLLAMLCGFFSILLSLEGHQHYLRAAQFIMVAMILDGLDGNLARKLKGTSPFGAELDTYVDMTAFGLAPAVLIYQFALHGFFLWRVLMTASVVLSGVIRLARFKVNDVYRGQAGYCGLPITASAGWVAMFVFLSETGAYGNVFNLYQGPVAILFLIGVIAMISLQVSNIRYPKPSKQMSIFIPCVVLVLLLFVPYGHISRFSAILMVILGVSYVIIGPFFVSYQKRKENGRISAA
jgi:CDP-diacylglycerol---serine O-phosphatidyltransferase